ncbi:Transposable element Tc1 transposase [Araneus ventricosus]|uniref:Transposable element Tc1 transposase n=1 Tax=Araneus ventricosus TaxID=182803 RepID=A0A4Y2TIW5_ARAVE|nr:Transposable element Tc1 transposase [Araneus ventricosus]
MGLSSRRPTRVPLLTKHHRQLRLQWTREHRDWTMHECKRVAWSDESRFLIHHADGRVRVRRLPGEQLLPSCTAGHTQAGGGSIILWGTLSWASLGPIVVVEQTMKPANYLNIIADQLYPYMAFVFPTGNGIFQQDNAPCRKARIVLEWFDEHTDEFHLISWPPNSPDLNPMENIWDVMERQLRAQTPPCPHISTLRDRCLDIWYNLSPIMYQKLLASMPITLKNFRNFRATARNFYGHQPLFPFYGHNPYIVVGYFPLLRSDPVLLSRTLFIGQSG